MKIHGRYIVQMNYLAFAFALQKAQTSKRADTLYQNIKAFNTMYLTKKRDFGKMPVFQI